MPLEPMPGQQFRLKGWPRLREILGEWFGGEPIYPEYRLRIHGLHVGDMVVVMSDPPKYDFWPFRPQYVCSDYSDLHVDLNGGMRRVPVADVMPLSREYYAQSR